MSRARRIDHRLRESITVLEKMLLKDPSRDEIILTATDLLTDLLRADTGAGYLYHPTDDVKVMEMEHVASTNTEQNAANHGSLHSQLAFPENYLHQIKAKPPVFTDMLDPLYFPSFRGSDVTNCLVVPLLDADVIRGVIFICNYQLIECDNIRIRLRPFIAATNCLFRAVDRKPNPRREFHKNYVAHDTPTLESVFKVFDSVFNTVFLVDEDERIVIGNNAASVMFGMPKHEIIGKNINYFLPQGSPRLDTRIANVIKDTGLPKSVWRGVPVIRADRTRGLVDLSTFDFTSSLGNLRGYAMDDISEKMETAANYHDTLQRFDVLTNIAPVAIIQINNSWQCIYANDTWCNYTQMTPDESDSAGWLKGIHPDDSAQILNKLQLDCSTEGEFESEFRLTTPLGHVRWVKANACSVLNSLGRSDGLIITFSDITDRLNNEKRLQNIAERDQLTGLVNRALFNDRLEIALKGVSRFGAAALIFLDLDDFKHVNDTLGHDAGDALLEQIAQRLTTSLRDVDTIARIGGDEFTLILTNIECTHHVTIVADKLIASLVEPFYINDQPIYASASLGISYEDKPHQDPKIMLKQADIALYKAKEAGKNQYRFYSAELDKHSNLNILLRQSLKDSARDDFSVVYQPQINAVSGRIVGLEALSRWKHEETIEDPTIQKCISVIEQSGLINDFSHWLFKKVLSDLNSWTKRGLIDSDIRVSINVSAKQFRNKSLATLIQGLCLDHEIRPSMITLEITESAIIDDPKSVFDTLRQLSLMGFYISLDDFGTGYSSLSYLQKMPINEVKIDRSFIQDIGVNQEDKTIVLAIINLAKTLGLTIVAEGVENAATRDWLTQQDCSIQQGFFFYKPQKKPEIEALFRDNCSPAAGNVVMLKK